jgi:hypothetical protein
VHGRRQDFERVVVFSKITDLHGQFKRFRVPRPPGDAHGEFNNPPWLWGCVPLQLSWGVIGHESCKIHLALTQAENRKCGVLNDDDMFWGIENRN